jgi:hypothetical protein
MVGIDGSIVRRFAPIAERAARTKTKVCSDRLQLLCATGLRLPKVLLESCQRVGLWPFARRPCDQLRFLEIRIRMNGAFSVKRWHNCRRHLERVRYSGNSHAEEHEDNV